MKFTILIWMLLIISSCQRYKSQIPGVDRTTSPANGTPGSETPSATTPASTTPTPTPTMTPTASTTQDDMSFGPFGTDETKLLTTLETTKGKYVDLKIDFDIESHPDCSYDYVLIEDGDQMSQRICNQGSLNLKSLKTPVKVTFKADARTESKSVKLKGIKFHND